MITQCLLPFLSVTALSQVSSVRLTTIVPPAGGNSVFVAGSFNHWTTGDSLYRMTKVNDSTYTIVLPVYRDVPYQYKYTLGSWSRVEIAANDSNISNRRFLCSSRKIRIRDVVGKWKTPSDDQKMNPQMNPQMTRIMKMKDSVLSGLQPRLNELQVLLKQYIINLLQDQPSEVVDQKITAELVQRFANAYGSINAFCHQVSGDMSPEQKRRILTAVNSPAGDRDVINTFLSALAEAMKEVPKM